MSSTEMSSAELNPGFVTVEAPDRPGRFRPRPVVEIAEPPAEEDLDEAPPADPEADAAP